MDEEIKSILEKVVNDATTRYVAMKPLYDSVDMGTALLIKLFNEKLKDAN